ncbi:MAG: proton-conducting membrane transporter [Butyrivibrio sp.]|nr:proton-conducting membrane transporter [Butyrivibrio sp.]
MSYSISELITITFKADTLGIVFSVFFAFIFILVGTAAKEYMEHEGGVKRFYVCFFLTLIMLELLCYAGNFFTFYLFFEAMTFVSMPMVMHEGTHESVMAALKYLFYSVGGAFLTLFGFFLFVSKGYELVFTAGGSTGDMPLNGIELAAAFLMILGFGTKAGMFPMHGWLPTAHPVAPSPASAVLSGVITKAGVFGIIRCIYYVIGCERLKGTWVQSAFLILTLITVFMGSMMAYSENVLKKRLAYSTVSQVSYVLFGLALMNRVAFLGAVLHVFFHSLVKDMLFLSAGAIIMKSGCKNVSDLSGIGRRMPVTMWCFTLCSVTLIGIPPTSAFMSKWYLGVGSLESGIPVIRWLGPVILLISALLTAGYLLTVSLDSFFGKDRSGEDKIGDPGFFYRLSMLILTALSVALGIFPGHLSGIIESIADAVIR